MIEDGPPTKTGPPGDPNLGKYSYIANLDSLLATVEEGITLPGIAVDVGGSQHVHGLVDVIPNTEYWDGAPILIALTENPLELPAEWPTQS